MPKNELCLDCKHYKNGWCNVRKTNKGLGDLLECVFKEIIKADNLKMKVYQVSGESNSTQFNDIAVAESQEQLSEILSERYGNLLRLDSSYISLEKVRIGDLTTGDFVRLIKDRK